MQKDPLLKDFWNPVKEGQTPREKNWLAGARLAGNL